MTSPEPGPGPLAPLGRQPSSLLALEGEGPRLLSPRVLPLPAPPRWALRAIAVLAPLAAVLEVVSDGLGALAVVALVVPSVRLGAWLERAAFLWIARRTGLGRLVLVGALPLLGVGVVFMAGFFSEPLSAVDEAVFPTGEGPLVGIWLAITLPAALWVMGAALGSISITFIDVVISAVVRGFRERITLAILFLVSFIALPVGAVVFLADQARRNVEKGLPPVESGRITSDGEDAAQKVAAAGEWFMSNPWAITAAGIALGVFFALPAVISACSKLADAVLERIRPLMVAFDAVASGERHVRVEEAGSTELTELARHFNRMIERITLGERMERAFGVYVGEKLLTQIRAQHGEAQLPAETRDATVYFADIRGFTTMSELLPPERVVAILNRYFERIVAVIDRHDGYLDKFIGDAVVVVFNGPLPQPDHAARAVRCAVAMLATVREMNEAGAFPEVGELKVGAGMSSGPMVCGNIGSAQKIEYTVIGDAVNLASRVEGLTKQYGAALLVTEATRALVGDDDTLTFRRVDKVAAKGKSEAVVLHEVLEGHGPAQWGLRRQTLPAFDAGFEAYLSGDFTAAAAHFDGVLAENPDDDAAKLLADRCRRLAAAPPLAPWDGVFRMTTK